jgi:hypothetical protein
MSEVKKPFAKAKNKTSAEAETPSTPIEETSATFEDTTELESKDSDEASSTVENEEAPVEESDTLANFEETAENVPERLVKVLLAENYDGCIGGTWYHLQKDKTYSVPADVKRLLNSQAGRLKPL